MAGSAGLVGLAGCLGGQGSGGSFPSQDINWLIPYPAGGGFDTYSRAFEEFLPPQLPNDVDVVAQNVTGASGRRCINQINQAEPDGYTVGVFNIPGFIAQQIALDVDFDLREFSWLARFWRDNYAIVVHPDSPYQTLEDMQNSEEEVTFASTGGGTSTLVGIFAVNALDIPAKVVGGYGGSRESATAVMRGDVDARVNNVSGFLRNLVNEGRLHMVVSLSHEPPDYAPDVPTAGGLGYEAVANNANIQGLVGGPPDIPEERRDTLETAIIDAQNSDAMQGWSEENKRPLNPAGQEEATQVITGGFETWAEYEDLYADLLS